MNELDNIQNKIYVIRAQFDAISTALAELQAKPAVDKPRRPIGFIQPKDEDDFQDANLAS